MKKVAKIVFIILSSLLALVLISVMVFGIIFRNEISAISSIKVLKPRVENSLQCNIYEMTFTGDYYFDDFIAQGGSKNDRELLDFIMNKMTKGLLNLKIQTSKIGCSSFTARKSDGEHLFARNYDLYSTNTCIVRVKGNKKRHASISTVDTSFINIPAQTDMNNLLSKAYALAAPYAPLDGLNDAGVSCGIYMTYQGVGKNVIATDQNTDLPDISPTALIRLILDYADSLDEAVDFARSYDMHDSAGTSFHIMVAEPSGRSAILEWVNDTDESDNYGSLRKLIVTYNDQDSNIGQREGQADFQWVTNFIIQPGYYKVYNNDLTGWERYNIIYDELSKSGGLVADEMAAMDILHKVSQRTVRPNRNADDYVLTIHSVIYNLDDLSTLWCGNEQYADKEGMFRYKLNSKKRIFE
jgi:hypothetical protein